MIWLATSADTARDRAVHSNIVHNGYGFKMTPEQFSAIANHLELPSKDEKVIKINGVKLDRDEVMRLLS